MERHELAAEVKRHLLLRERSDGERVDRRQLAHRIGIKEKTLYAYLNGTTLPPASRLDRLLYELGVAEDEVVRLCSARDEIQLNRAAAEPPESPYHLARLKTVLRLDTPTPEAYELRRVVAGQHGLREVRTALDLPREAGQAELGLAVTVLFGAQLEVVESPRPHRREFVLRLPRPLRAGESAEYCLHLRVAPGEPMRQHYIFTPERRCDQFALRIRFHPGQLPSWVRQVSGEPVRAFDAAQAPAESIAVDAVGEVCADFPKPALHLGYGLQWG
ncbi:helix-turn-helix domain-containing protein [Longispora albida]|uniref:helix-turn-helix domain-containing protein n=1 Tax=Longispora albida TaxID=203523 RepID=UPI0003617077|nr:helix-turn-helix transcriptional regulator [Longispora albida]